MAGQVAIACILLIGAVLVGRSLQALIDIDRGYDPSNLLTARLPLPSGPTYGATSAAAGNPDRLQALPGVTHAAFGNALPLVSAGGMTGLNVRLPRDPSTVAKVQTLHRTVDPEFRRDGIAAASRPPADRQRQRDLTARARGEQVVRGSVSRRRSDRTASPASPYRHAEWEIVGVVDDMKQGGLQTAGFITTADTAQPEMFSSYRQFGPMRLDTVFFVVRTAGDPSSLAPALCNRARAGPALVLDSVMTMDDRLMSSSRGHGLTRSCSAAWQFALAIAAVGLFGVLSYTVAQLARVRTALGARTADILGSCCARGWRSPPRAWLRDWGAPLSW